MITLRPAMAAAKTFKDENQALVEMVREWNLVRSHNMKFKAGDDLSTAMLFAEAGLICMICEHFIRMVVEKSYPGQSNGMQLRGLLDFAVARNMFKLPFKNAEKGKQAICDYRNALLHGNHAQLARQMGCASVAEYFRDNYAAELEVMNKTVGFIMEQIDVTTGKSKLPSPAKKKAQRKDRRA